MDIEEEDDEDGRSMNSRTEVEFNIHMKEKS